MDGEPTSTQAGEPQNGALDTIDRYVRYVAQVFWWIAGAALTGMLILVVADIIGIKVFSKPVPGGIEYVSFLAVVMTGFAISYTQLRHGHVAVDFVVGHLPLRPRLIIAAVMLLFSAVLVALLAYYTWEYAGILRTTGEVSMTQKIPFYPFVYGLAICYVVLLLVLLLQVAQTVGKAVATWTR